MVRHLLTLQDLTDDEILKIVDLGIDIKKNPEKYSNSMKQKSLLMIFAKPSLRTRVSFEVGMTQLGGHGIYYNISTSPMGKKETIADTGRTASRYVNAIVARLFEHKDIEELAKYASVPVINALTNFTHPCQILSDLQTIKEKKGRWKGLKLAYFGDSNNNVTHSLLLGASKVGMDIYVSCPEGKEYEPNSKVVEWANENAKRNGSKVVITHNPKEAVKDADVIYTDSWMSYHIPPEKKEERIHVFKPYQVNKELVSNAKSDYIFMNCLPAMRGMEQTADIIDGENSVVFDQAENRLHTQKAIMLFLLEKM